MTLNEIEIKIKEMLPEKRLKHSKNVAKCASKLSEIYGYNKDEAYIAGLVHDCAKYLNQEEINKYVRIYNIDLDELEINSSALSHSIIGAYIAKYQFGIDNPQVLSAIRYHTTGKANMSLLEKIIYIADLIEENREFSGVKELRELVYEGKLDKAIFNSLNNTIKFVIDNNQPIHQRSIEARNYLLKINANS